MDLSVTSHYARLTRVQEVPAPRETTSAICSALLTAVAADCGRYVDMIVTEGVIDTFRTRSLVNSTIRRFLEDKEFLEARVAATRWRQSIMRATLPESEHQHCPHSSLPHVFCEKALQPWNVLRA